MRYLSVCSGIEAASVAWHHLGWTPVGFSEIEPFPSAVLAHRFPDIPNFGDMTKHEQWTIERGSVDLLVGGTPCQSFSVAGLRKGLADPRGNLMLTYLAIAARLRPRWLVWENVPGVLSSNGGRDFGSFLGALGELGYGYAYRVLDAQFVRVGRWSRAVPQRRRRVFAIGCLGDWTAAAEVLALREGVQRHLEASRKTRKGAAADAEGGTRGGCWWDGGQVSQTLDAVLSKGQTMPDKNRFPAVLQPTTVRSGSIGGFVEDTVGGTMRHHGGDLQGGSESLVIAQPVAFQQNTRDEVRLMNGDGQIAGALAAEAGMKQQNYVAQPTEVSGTITARFGQSRNNHEECVVQPTVGTLCARDYKDVGNQYVDEGKVIAQPLPIQDGREIEKRQNGLGIGQAGDPAYTVDTTAAQAVAQPVPYDLFQITAPVNRQNRKPGDPCHTLARDNAAHAAVAFTVDMQACKGNANIGNGTVSPTLCKPSGNDVHAVAIGTDCYNGAITGDVAATMGTPGSSVNASGPTVMQAVAHSLRADGFDAGEDGTGRGTPLVPVAPSLTATNDPSRSPQSSEVTQQVAAVHASTMTVRRLSPRECERLQGFPDDWTLIPWRGKPAEECPDGPRYKALGNSMACNCMAWIGERINAKEKQ